MSEYAPAVTQGDDPNFCLYSTHEFYDIFNGALAEAGADDQVTILTMAFEPERPRVAETLKLLGEAASRKADISFGVDAYAFLLDTGTSQPGPYWLPGNITFPHYRHTRNEIQKLNEFPNVTSNVINVPGRPFSNPYAGRSHIKLYVLNDMVNVGGPNMAGSEDSHDFVISWRDEKSAQQLHGMARAITNTGNTRSVLGDEDFRVPITSDTDLLVDVGVPGQSLIQDVALDLIDETASRSSEVQDWLVFSGQFFPQGSIREHAVVAYRAGVDTAILFNHPRNHDAFRKRLWQRAVIAVEGRRLPKGLLPSQRAMAATCIHGAAIASKHRALVGGENFEPNSRSWGTTELEIETRNERLAYNVGSRLLMNADRPLLESMQHDAS